MLNLAHICGIDFPFNKEVHSDWSRIILFNNIRCMENDIVLWIGLALWDQYSESK